MLAIMNLATAMLFAFCLSAPNALITNTPAVHSHTATQLASLSVGPLGDITSGDITEVVEEARRTAERSHKVANLLGATELSTNVAIDSMEDILVNESGFNDTNASVDLEDVIIVTDQPNTSYVQCIDNPISWTSLNGATCVDYQLRSWCTSSGDYGAGWGEFGTFGDWADLETGITALDACCVCGGGLLDGATPPTPVPTPAPTPALTPMPTPTPTPAPTPELYYGNEIFGTGQYTGSDEPTSFISVGAHNGTASAPHSGPVRMPHSRAEVLNSVDASTQSTAESNEVSFLQVDASLTRCVDIHKNWTSRNGRTCLDFKYQRWCTEHGLYGPTWNPMWGTFEEWASLETHDSASEVCCACGGGQRPASSGCVDSSWRSRNGATCLDYQLRDWCTSDGGYGRGWQHYFGVFEDWRGTDGKTGRQACCFCGGGTWS